MMLSENNLSGARRSQAGLFIYLLAFSHLYERCIMPNLPSIEVVVTLRLAFDVTEPYEGVGSNKEPFTVVSCTGDGSMQIGSEAVPVYRFQVARFKRGDGDQLFAQLLTLKRGDRVRFSMALEVKPFQTVKAGKSRDNWAMQPGQPYSLRVLERAQVGELIEA